MQTTRARRGATCTSNKEKEADKEKVKSHFSVPFSPYLREVSQLA